jgi:hypothetical protein
LTVVYIGGQYLAYEYLQLVTSENTHDAIAIIVDSTMTHISWMGQVVCLSIV